MVDNEVKSQDADMKETSPKPPLKPRTHQSEMDNVVNDSASETSSIISVQPTIKLSSKNIQLLDDGMMLGDSGSESEVTASLNLQSNESSTLGQTEMKVKMLKSARKSINFNNMEPPISLEKLSINESGLTSFLNITGLTENLPFSFDSLRELDINENDEVPYSLREQVEDDSEINKAQPAETEENESHQSDFSPTDGSDFDPESISMHDKEYDEYEFYDDPIVKRTKKRLKNKCEKLSKKTNKENKKFLKSSSKYVPEETISPKTQKQLPMEEVEKKESQNKSGDNKRSWTRRNACFYCQQLVTNFTRHLLRHHENEIEVIQYKSIKDEDPKIRKMKRQEITDKIRNKGNFLHNSKVCFDRDGSMTLLPAKRRNNDMTSSPSSFATCKNCLGTFKRSTFYKHFKKCGTNTSKGRVLTKNSITIIPNTDTASEELKKKILPHFRADDTALVVKNDRLILAYGTRLLKKKKERRSRKAICSKMRDLATLLMLIRNHDSSVETLTDALDPEKYEVFIAAVKEMCGFNEDTGQVRVPSIPARILPAVLGCVDILYSQSIMSSESTAFKELYKKKLDDFKQLVTINWQWEVSSNAEKTKKRRNMVKENVLPLEDVIKTVMETIAKLEVKYGRKLKIDCNVINYESLCTVTIAHIIMLDRKRAGDVAEAELTFYINRKNEEIPEEVLKTLTPQQRKSIKTLDVFQIPGKRTRSVPILLTKTMKENIDLIIACRDDLKIPITNPLLFARPSTDEPFDGGKCLDKIKKLCNLKRPEMLTSTGMRHHIATMSQLHAKQNDQYTEHLAGFLGHDIAVHAKNYRLPLQVLQKAVVGSQLMKYEPYQNRSPGVPPGSPVKSGENSEQETHSKEKSKDNEENSKEENEEDIKRESEEDNGENDNKKSKIKKQRDEREESKENYEEKSKAKNQVEIQEINYTDDFNNVPGEPYPKLADNKESEEDNGENDNKKSKMKKQRDDREESKENFEEKSKAKNQVEIQEINYTDDFNNVPGEPYPKLADNKESEEDNGENDNKKSKMKKQRDDREESKENLKEKSKAKNQVEIQEINYTDDFNNVPGEPFISKLNETFTKINSIRKNQNYGNNIQTRFKRKNANQRETKEKNNKKVTKPKKTKQDLYYSSEDFSDGSNDIPTQKRTKKHSLEDNEEDNDQMETKKKSPKESKKQNKARLNASSSSEDLNNKSCKKLIKKKTKKRSLQDSDEEINIGRKKKTKKCLLQDSDEEELIVQSRNKSSHRFWTNEEVKAVKFYFKDYIKNKINPGKAKCLEMLKKAPVLQTRTWMQLNSYVNNIYKNK